MILLYSGGLDSYIAWEFLKRPKTLYVDLGHRYAALERNAIRKTIPETIIEKRRVYLGDVEEEDAHIPMRNAFLVLAAALYDAEIALVVQKGEMDIPDRSPEFFAQMSQLLRTLRGREGRVFTPFPHLTKTQMVKWYVEQGLDPEALKRTWSCYKAAPPEKHCGRCSACFRRWVALSNNGITEEYQYPPWKWEGVEDYLRRMNAGLYDAERTEETFRALKRVGVL